MHQCWTVSAYCWQLGEPTSMQDKVEFFLSLCIEITQRIWRALTIFIAPWRKILPTTCQWNRCSTRETCKHFALYYLNISGRLYSPHWTTHLNFCARRNLFCWRKSPHLLTTFVTSETDEKVLQPITSFFLSFPNP